MKGNKSDYIKLMQQTLLDNQNVVFYNDLDSNDLHDDYTKLNTLLMDIL